MKIRTCTAYDSYLVSIQNYIVADSKQLWKLIHNKNRKSTSPNATACGIKEFTSPEKLQ